MKYHGGISILKYLFDCVLEVIYPREYTCLACRDIIESGVLCVPCTIKGARIDEPYNIKGMQVHSCRYYSSAFRELIIEYKSLKNFEVGDYFIELLLEKINEKKLEFDYISFVPSSRAVIKRRGFDHIKYLAKGISDKLNKEIVILLSKNDDVKEQKFLGSLEREKNMRTAFKSCGDIDFMRGKKVLFIDDILTTGSTLKVCKEFVEKNHKIEIILLTVLKSSI